MEILPQYENHEMEWREEENENRYNRRRRHYVTDPRDPDFIMLHDPREDEGEDDEEAI
jgi:hypothetical protein